IRTTGSYLRGGLTSRWDATPSLTRLGSAPSPMTRRIKTPRARSMSPGPRGFAVPGARSVRAARLPHHADGLDGRVVTEPGHSLAQHAPLEVVGAGGGGGAHREVDVAPLARVD